MANPRKAPRPGKAKISDGKKEYSTFTTGLNRYGRKYQRRAGGITLSSHIRNDYPTPTEIKTLADLKVGETWVKPIKHLGVQQGKARWTRTK